MKKNLLLLVLVAVLAHGAIWYIYNYPDKKADMSTYQTYEDTITNEMMDDSQVVEAVSTPVESDTVETETQPVASDTSSAEEPAAVSVESELSAIDALFEESYDDSSLDASFETNLDEPYVE